MRLLNLSGDAGPPRHILCLGAHCDDIEIGAGGTLLRLVAAYPKASFHWVVFSGNDEREAETRRCGGRLLAGAAAASIEVHRFRNGYFPWLGAQIKDAFEDLKGRVEPDLVFTHCRHDRHQDHRLISDLTWNTFRDHLVLEYEVPKYDGDTGSPNIFFPLTDAQRRAKVDALMDCFASQQGRVWFDRATFDALMRIRGMESNAPSGYAEAFFGRKWVM